VATTHREVETKHDVPESFEVPPLDALPGVASVDVPDSVDLEATYYDTADHRLADARITLRRRTGGDDEGWHLKLPAEGVAREEVRAPLGRSARVPARLAALVRSRTRGESVAPMARLRTHRSMVRLRDADGAVLAEVADDRVEAETLGDAPRASAWREVEVEVVEADGAGGRPDPEALLAAAAKELEAAGASPAVHGSKLARVLDRPAAAPPPTPTVGGPALDTAVAYLHAQVEQLLSRDPRVRLDAPDSVHKMRVATRRLRSALATYRGVLDRDVTDPVRDELRWLGGVLGAARDAEVQGGRLEGSLEALDTPRSARTELLRRLRATRRDAHRTAVGELDGDRYLRLLDTLAALVADPPRGKRADRAAADQLPRLARKDFARLRRAVDAARAADDPAEKEHLLHEARKAAKRMRYAAESMSVPLPDAAALAAAVEEIQEVLGEHQDAVAARVLVADLARSDGTTTAAAFALGRVHTLEVQRAEAARAGVPAVWKAARRRKLRRWMR
jgi:CHAD domain-containing protein